MHREGKKILTNMNTQMRFNGSLGIHLSQGTRFSPKFF